MITKCVLVVSLRLQDVSQVRAIRRRLRERESPIRPTVPLKPHNEDAFAVLRDVKLCVQYLVMDAITKTLQLLLNDLEGAAAVVRLQVAHVLQQQHWRPLRLKNARNLKEKVALLIVIKAVRVTQAVFL